jgi:hypothetical protein
MYHRTMHSSKVIATSETTLPSDEMAADTQKTKQEQVSSLTKEACKESKTILKSSQISNYSFKDLWSLKLPLYTFEVRSEKKDLFF